MLVLFAQCDIISLLKKLIEKGNQMLDTKECSGKVISTYWLIDKGNINFGNRCYEVGTVGHKWVKLRPPQSYTHKRLGIKSNWTKVPRADFERTLAWNVKNDQDVTVGTLKQYSRKSKWEV